MQEPMLMKLLDWVGWSERKWKMPTCMKISRLCRLLVVQIGAETVTFMLCWFHTNPSKTGLDLNKSTEFQKLSLWTRLSAKPFSPCENEFYLHANKNHFHTNGFALRLALKQRLDATEKWPITASGASWPRTIQVKFKRISWRICMESSSICTGTLIFDMWTLFFS